MNNRPSLRRIARGIGIVEALVSLLVLALGMMSFAALQARLRLNSDVAKQRSEAVRLAQEDVENFRALGTLAADGTIANNLAYAGITTGATSRQITGSNATFTLTRQVAEAPRAAGVTDAAMKNLVITVTWADRSAQTVAGVVQDNQSITLRAIISRSDPAVAASLALPANGSPVRDLLARDIQIPIPSKNLGDGTSAIKPLSSGNVAYVFSNDSGLVTQRCVGGSLATTATGSLSTTVLDGATCEEVSAYLISGFVRFDRSNSPSPTNPNQTEPGAPPPPPTGDETFRGTATQMRLDLSTVAPPYVGGSNAASLLRAANWPVVNSATPVTTGYPRAPECNIEAMMTVRYTTPVSFTQVNNGVTQTVTSTIVVAIVPQYVVQVNPAPAQVVQTPVTPAGIAPHVGVSSANASATIIDPVDTGERFLAYSCLVFPIDLDGNGLVTPPAYTGRLAVWPSSWTLGTTSTTSKVCRYSADLNQNALGEDNGVYAVDVSNLITRIDNEEHPYAYLNVQRSLSNQNFLVVRGDRACPTDGNVEVDGQGGENYTDETTVTHQP